MSESDMPISTLTRVSLGQPAGDFICHMGTSSTMRDKSTYSQLSAREEK